MLVHVAVAGVVHYGVTHLPRINEFPLPERYSVRQIDMRELDPNFPQMPDLHRAENKIPHPGPDVIRELHLGPSPQLSEEMHSFLQHAEGRPARIQPEIHSRLSFASKIPQPNNLAWTADTVAHKRIIPAAQDLHAAAEIETLPGAPHQAIHPADIFVPSTELSPPSEAVPAPFRDGLALAIPTTATISTAPLLESATSAAVLSLSEIRMLDQTVMVSPVDQTAAANAAGNATLERGVNLADGGDGAKREDAGDAAIDGRPLSTEHIVLPKNGKFSVVAVGSSLAEEYPQTADIWADRVAYTAYLHVGLGKSWILQYSATRAADMADAGRVERLDAPWPYDILRPNLLSRDVHADALMVHGVLNQAGRLESLAVAFPSSFHYTSFVLRALSQWQFRPALENGQATPVEVLLIIPEEMD